MGACGTALGGLVVVAQPDMSYARLGVLQVQALPVLMIRCACMNGACMNGVH